MPQSVYHNRFFIPLVQRYTTEAELFELQH